MHRVCVSASHRRKSVALALLSEYLKRWDKDQTVKGARLITHGDLVPLYSKAGFGMVGESAVVHGKGKWFEMKVDFDENAAAVVEEEDANVRSPGKVLASFKGMDDLMDQETKLNKADLFCPRAECRCLLLKAGAGKWVLGHKGDLMVRPVPSPSPGQGADYLLTAP
jgi:hypothetical protein